MDLIYDNNPVHITPWLVLCILALNIMAFIFMVALPEAGTEAFVNDFAANGAQLSGHIEATGAVPQWLTLLTATFLHGDFFHIFANMYALLIFGDNIEYAFGRVRFFLFYIAACFFSSGVSAVLLPESDVNSFGASGAVAAVLGAYFVLYPRAEIDYFLGYWERPILFWGIKLEAWFFILLWFAADFYFTVTGQAVEKTMAHGIDYLSHVAGFLMGAILAKMLRIHYNESEILDIKRESFRERAAARRRTKAWRDDDSWRDNG